MRPAPFPQALHQMQALLKSCVLLSSPTILLPCEDRQLAYAGYAKQAALLYPQLTQALAGMHPTPGPAALQ